MGGDVSAGLALAEMIAGLSKPTVSLVIGESHSIGGGCELLIYSEKCNRCYPSCKNDGNNIRNQTDL